MQLSALPIDSEIHNETLINQFTRKSGVEKMPLTRRPFYASHFIILHINGCKLCGSALECLTSLTLDPAKLKPVRSHPPAASSIFVEMHWSWITPHTCCRAECIPSCTQNISSWPRCIPTRLTDGTEFPSRVRKHLLGASNWSRVRVQPEKPRVVRCAHWRPAEAEQTPGPLACSSLHSSEP